MRLVGDEPGLPSANFLVQVIPLYSEFDRLLMLMSFCFTVSTQCELWEVPLTPPSTHSLPGKPTGREEERLRIEKRKQRTQKRVKGLMVRQAILQMHGRRNAVAQFPCVFTLPSPQRELAVVLCAPTLTRGKVQGESGSSPHPAYGGYCLIPTLPCMMKTLHSRVFTVKTATKADILVRLELQSPTPQT